MHEEMLVAMVARAEVSSSVQQVVALSPSLPEPAEAVEEPLHLAQGIETGSGPHGLSHCLCRTWLKRD